MKYMFDCFVSELLVIGLLFISAFRIFFIRKSKIDSAAFLAPIAFLLSLINIYLWNVSPITLIPAVLAFFMLLTNIRSLLRLSARLYVDRYSGAFFITSIIQLAAVSLSAVFLITNRPVKIDAKDFDSSKKLQLLSGNFSRGFLPAKNSEFFKFSNSFLYTYEPLKKNNEESPLIIFCSSDLTEVLDYEPYLLFLSKRGFTVLAADFYADDLHYFEGVWNTRFLRKFYARYALFFKDEKIDSQKLSFNQELSYTALIDIAKKQYSEKKIFFVTDSLNYETIVKISENLGDKSTGFYSLARLGEYKSQGLGFVEQTDIFTANKLDLERDKTLFIPRYAARKTTEDLNLFLVKDKTESDK